MQKDLGKYCLARNRACSRELTALVPYSKVRSNSALLPQVRQVLLTATRMKLLHVSKELEASAPLDHSSFRLPSPHQLCFTGNLCIAESVLLCRHATWRLSSFLKLQASFPPFLFPSLIFISINISYPTFEHLIKQAFVVHSYLQSCYFTES